MSSPPSVALTVVAVLLVVVAGVLAAAESAVTRLTRGEAARLVADRRRGAAAVQRATGDPAVYLTTSTFLRVATETAAAVCFTLALTGVLGGWPVVLATSAVVMGVVSFLLVGVGPRTLGRQHAEGIALATAPALGGATRVLRPLVRALVAVGNAVTPGRGYRDGPFASETELREMVDLASESAVIEAGERRMIHSVFELGDTIVREVMVPRTDMVTVPTGTTLHDAMTLFLRSGFSRVPVAGESTDDLLGLLYLKDVARRLHVDPDQAGEPVDLLARPPVWVPESKPIDVLLREMQRDSTHVAVVIDEYGGTAGLVTIEDILEEIVGEIADEYDRDVPGVEPVEEGAYRLSARLPIDDLAELFSTEVDDDDVDSVGGLLARHLGKVPIPGDEVEVAGLVLVAERREGRRNRIATVLARRAPADVAAGTPGAVATGADGEAGERR